MMKQTTARISGAVLSVNERLTRHRLIGSGIVAAALAALLALYNISSGPLHNLNDIGGWSNRALFIGMSALVHAGLLMLLALMSRVCFARTTLRQIILTAGYYILLLAINQKAYVYVNVLQPLIRAMDAGGLAAGAAMEHTLSAPMLVLLYLITRGPVYDMYLLKLFAVACFLLIALLVMLFADKNGLGLRAEALLACCVILPQGFMNAACSALPETAAVMLLGMALTLVFGCDRPRMTASLILFGAACALSGVCLYALPVYFWLCAEGKMKKRALLLPAGVMFVLCLPAVMAGMPLAQAAGSLFAANFAAPAYASGSPGIFSLIPRALPEEIPQYAPVLRHMQLDTVTFDQEFYTGAHFEAVMRGLALAGLAAYMGVCALMRGGKHSPLCRALILTLSALIVCPNTTSAAWLAADMLCLYAIFAAPDLRLCACMVLFATAGASCYPMTEEVLLPMVWAFVLCLLALGMLLGLIPKRFEVKAHE